MTTIKLIYQKYVKKFNEIQDDKMIEGLKTYGSDKLVKELPDLKNPIFICAIATTETSKIPGLTGAGATPEQQNTLLQEMQNLS